MAMWHAPRRMRRCARTVPTGGSSAHGGAESGYRSLPATPAIVAAFLTLLAEKGFVPDEPRWTRSGRVLPPKEPVPLGRSTIGRRLAAIVFAHRTAGCEPPTSQPDAARLDRAMRAIRRERRNDLPARKRAADGDVLRDMLRSIEGESLRAYRDRALPQHRHGGRVPPLRTGRDHYQPRVRRCTRAARANRIFQDRPRGQGAQRRHPRRPAAGASPPLPRLARKGQDRERPGAAQADPARPAYGQADEARRAWRWW